MMLVASTRVVLCQRPCLQLLHPSSTRRSARRSTWASAGKALSFFKFGSPAPKLPEVVEAGDPVLNEAAAPVPIHEITSERIQRIIHDMISVMRAAPGVGLSAPQLGIPLQIIVLEDTKEYISYVQKEETNAQQRFPFDLLVICNPILKKKGTKCARFFEGCLSLQISHTEESSKGGDKGLKERNLGNSTLRNVLLEIFSHRIGVHLK